MKKFLKVLINTLIANVTTSFLWFSLTFWAYLQTHSVIATAVIGGSYMLFVSLGSLFFGTFVDKHRKKNVMVLSSLVTLLFYIGAGILYLGAPSGSFSTLNSHFLWILIVIILIGSVFENMRNIALSTTVTILVPKAKRAQANGLVGAVVGVGFLVTSVFSGLAIGFLGMGLAIALAILFTAITLIHLAFGVSIPEDKIIHDEDLRNKKLDISGSIAAIKAVPGLFGLLLFSTFNNFLGGVYIALMDPYGLTLFSVQTWGVVFGVLCTGFIIGGLIVAKKGLGNSPLRTLLLANVAMSLINITFTIRELWVLYILGIFIYMSLGPIIEATEQTIIQRVVPLKQQGRVFGFSQSMETAAAPITALSIGPIAEYWILPYMQSDIGKFHWGWLLGSGDARGIALIFTVTGLVMLAVTLLAFKSRSYRILSKFYAKS